MADAKNRARNHTPMPRPHADWNLPPRYKIQNPLIGTGSYGFVCEAHDNQERRVVAIKKIHRVFEDLVDCKRILREIAILNRLYHEHIVKVVDICVPEDLMNFDELYLVLEISDSDLKKLFRQHVYLSDKHIKTLLYNLVVGVHYIHSAGVYHRDLKPANCLVNQDCGVKICDFGLARTVDFSDPTPPPTSPRELMTGGVPHNERSKKQLTSHVVTRWYRAPEVILLQENYTEAIDMWSVGCIFAELLNMREEHCQVHTLRSPIFPGNSSFPLSPDHRHATDYKYHTRGNKDQLEMIFNILGTPTETDIDAIEKEDARRYVRIFHPRAPSELKDKFPAASDDCINLLRNMLVFNPSRRISVEAALNHPYFEEVRQPEIEVTATSRVRLPFDDWGHLDAKQLRVAFLREVQRYHPEVVIPAELERTVPSSGSG